jgi:hypothetical protein
MKSFYQKNGALLSALAFVTIMLQFILPGCSKLDSLSREEAIVTPPIVSVGSSFSNVSTQIIYAGQTINAGMITYDDVDTNGDQQDDALQVTFQASNGWALIDVSFFVGNTLSDLPTNKSGNPIPGQFPYKSGNILGQTSYTLTIPFLTLGFSCPSGVVRNFYVAAHCNLRKALSGGTTYQYETGWGDGLRLLTRGNWAMYNQIYITCDVINNPPTAASTETAFAFDEDQSGCFQNYSIFLDNPQRWGWTNGAYAPGTYTFKIYAGAGQCDLSKGIYVGDLTVVYAGTSANVSYNLIGTNPSTNLPYTLREVHLYVGNEEFPKIANGAQAGEYTIAPGKFPYKSTGLTGSSYSFTVNNLSGSVYIIAHAVVHGFPE